MTIKDFQACVEFNIEHNIKHAILGLGAPGVGKSELVRQIGKKYGFKVIDIRLAQMSEVEIGGLIYPNKERTKTVWLSPEILPDEERDGKNTILLLDEITSCPKRVQVAAYQLILDRRIGQYHLPEGTFVIGLGNREDDDGVYIQLAGPLADRFEIHYIEPDFEGWKYDYALKHNVHPYVVNYLTVKPSALHTQQTDDDSMVFATPRSWVRVSDILHFDSNVNNAVIRNKIIGNIGAAEGTQFVAYCKKMKRYITADDFLGGARPPEEQDEMMVLTNSLAARVSFIENATSLSDLTAEQQELLRKVVLAMFRLGNPEFTVIGLKALLNSNRAVVRQVFLELDDPEITDFLVHNSKLLGLSPKSGGK